MSWLKCRNLSNDETFYSDSYIIYKRRCFYFKFSDAFEWRDSEVILHSVICVNDEEFIDLEAPEGTEVYDAAVKYICDCIGMEPSKNAMANQCAVANIIWDTNPGIKVLASSFAKEKTKPKTLMDSRKRRREFCVRNNEYIRHTYMIRKDDVV